MKYLGLIRANLGRNRLRTALTGGLIAESGIFNVDYVASLVADQLYAQECIVGLACLGYPFHPPKKPEQLRTAHLVALACPALIVQGERDPFGTRAEVEGYGLSRAIRMHWAGDGDHDLGPRGGSGFTRKGNLAGAADAIAAFAKRVAQIRPRGPPRMPPKV